MKNDKRPCRRLRIALRSNGAFSLTSGSSLAVFSESIASTMGIPFPVQIQVIGIGLVAFGSSLFVIARSAIQTPSATLVWPIIVGDTSWVAFSILGLAIWGSAITSAGAIAILAIASIVALFAALQTTFLLQQQRSPAC